MAREDQLWERARQALSSVDGLLLLGPTDVHRLPIISFCLYHAASGLLLHHNFVLALLNDVFGIQARAGCMCAGPYAQRLLGIDLALARRFERLLLEDPRIDSDAKKLGYNSTREFSHHECLRPGLVRISFVYYQTDEEVDFVCSALRLAAQYAWTLLPQYILNPATGNWGHRERRDTFRERKWLSWISYSSGHLDFDAHQTDDDALDYAACLRQAQVIFDDAKRLANRIELANQAASFDGEAAALRWFLLPSEAKAALLNPVLSSTTRAPFMPKSYSVTAGGQPDSDLLLAPAPAVKQAYRWWNPGKKIWNKTVSAMRDFGMLKNGDRVIVCLSGGKDSLSLLHTFHQYQHYAKSFVCTERVVPIWAVHQIL